MSKTSLNYEYIIKIMILGDSGVGKTNLLLWYIKGEFKKSSKSTIGIDFFSKEIQIK